MDNNILSSKRILDAINSSTNNNRISFVGFLDENDFVHAKEIVVRQKFDNYMFWGGFDGAERVFFGAFPDYLVPDCESFPVVVLYVSISYSSCNLTHRDFLGALMGLGITRDSIGDILVGRNICAFCLKESLAAYVKSNLTHVGKYSISFIEDKALQKIPFTNRFDDVTGVVSSNRLDCVVSSLTHRSRSSANKIISIGSVKVNSVIVDSVSYKVHNSDKISISGNGKYIIDGIDNITKKGRLKLLAKKYR